MREIKIVFFVLILSISCFAQFDREYFFNRVNSIYHTLSETKVKNFSAWITSDHFELNAGGVVDTEIFHPLEMVWINPNRLFFIRHAVPDSIDSVKSANIFKLQEEIQQELKGIFLDWQRFNGQNLLDNLPADYQIYTVQDTVYIEAIDQDSSQSKYYFGKNGLCFKVITFDYKTKQKIVVFPEYALLGTKWLCTGWSIQIIKKKEIESGYEVKVRSDKEMDAWLPVGMIIRVQTRNKLNKTFTRQYKFRNIMTNRDFKIIDN